jgi:hypothetical protein
MTVNQWSSTTKNPIYEREAPCTCLDCPDCSIWDVWDEGILHLIARDNGYCYSTPSAENGEIYVTLPDVTTLTGPFCVTIKTTGYYLAIGVYEPSTHIIIDGVSWDWIQITPLGTACICYDGKNFIATGDVEGQDQT